ncbi:MAG: adenylate/guanylate cyclase domain-containing protein [Agitococcus sp.]|nr:adenylate/guanylate cyclase domain-containing protein [Agitococcus sp.]
MPQSILKADTEAEKTCYVRSYLRRPDAAFWLDLLAPPPKPTETDFTRRRRMTRYSLGAALGLSAFYVGLSLVFNLNDQSLIWLNGISVACYAMGMWAASLQAHQIARLWLMVTLNTQVILTTWLMADAINSSVFCFVSAALALVIFDAHEKKYRALFTAIPIIGLIITSLELNPAYIDIYSLPQGLLLFARVANLVVGVLCVLLLVGVFNREVLNAENGLVEERARSDRLLHAVLPQKIADELRKSDRMIANRHPEVTVLFADIAGFTPWSSAQEPEAVVSLLEKIFSRFDARLSYLGAEKIKTIGDAYMVVSGAPEPRADHAHVIANLALALLEEIQLVRQETGIALDMRIGVHTGSVIAGVIGAVRFSYDIWGDTVNTASRMESHGQAGRIQISQQTKERIEDAFVVEPRGMIDVKGKGEMETWWLIAPK